MTADPNFDLIFLDPTRVTLFRTGGSAIRATVSDPQLGEERTYLYVQIARAFPLSRPDRLIGLRDGKEKDIGMLASTEGLDAESRRILDEEMARRYFVPRVTRVKKAKKEFDTVTWDVETDKGSRVYVVQNLRESVLEVQPGRVIVTDRTGARFEFPEVSRAGAETISLLSRVLN
jgi:hypothetical protein